jgi:flagellar motor switch protein FliN/FliY
MDDLLSQDEISALLAGGDVGGDFGSGLSSQESEFLDKVAEIFSNAESNVIGMLAGKGVDVSVESTEVMTQEELRGKPSEVPFIFSATFGGFEDAPLAVLVEQNGALMLADLMMGGGGTELPEPSDLYWNAAQEGVSQIVGSAFTSLSGILGGRRLMPENTASLLGEGEWLAFAALTPDENVWVSTSEIKIEGLTPFKVWTTIPLDHAISLAKLSREIEEEKNRPAPAPAPAAPRAQSPSPAVDVRPAAFQPLGGGGGGGARSPIDIIADIPVRVTVELGKTRKSVSEILALTNGAVIELDKMAGEPVDILVNGKLIAKGEVVVIDENFGVRITDIIGVGAA